MTTIYDFDVITSEGASMSLRDLVGSVLLVVNTASECGFTPQYAELESLHQRYRHRGLVILGFPCNQFGAQEPGSDQEIAIFCQTNYGVSFPLFKKIQVNGPAADPLFNWLTRSAPGVLGTRRIKWNFTKFLIDRHGLPTARYAPTTKPNALSADIESLLSQR